MTESRPRGAGLGDALRRRVGLVGTFLLVPRVEIVDMLALAGFDAVILDLEHGPFTTGELLPLVVACRRARIHGIVRVPDLDAQAIGAALDLGAEGVLVPHVGTAVDAAAAVRAARFPPEGERSLNPFVRGAAYAGDAEYLRRSNREVAVMAMVEGVSALDELSGILAVPGLDAVFVGPMDLSGALGVPGEPEHDLVLAAIRGIVEAARPTATAVGIYAPSAAAGARWLALGASLVAVTADSHMILEGFRACREEVSVRLRRGEGDRADR